MIMCMLVAVVVLSMLMVVIMILMAMLMCLMFMYMLRHGFNVLGLFFGSVDGYCHMRAADSAAGDYLAADFYARYSKCIHFLQKPCLCSLIGQQFIQRCRQHISCRAHSTVKINRFHVLYSSNFGCMCSREISRKGKPLCFSPRPPG